MYLFRAFKHGNKLSIFLRPGFRFLYRLYAKQNCIAICLLELDGMK